MTAVLATALGLFFLTSNANAESVTVNSSARVVTPLIATSPTALAFGNLASSAVAGTVAVTSAGVRSAAGGSSLVAGAAVTAAVVNITAGEASATVNITYPGSATLTSGANTMTVNGFAAAGSPASVALNAGGTGTFNVGGTLAVGVSQATGNYAGTFNVTLAYQ